MANVSPAWHLQVYAMDIDEVLARVRFPQYLEYVGHRYGEQALTRVIQRDHKTHRIQLSWSPSCRASPLLLPLVVVWTVLASGTGPAIVLGFGEMRLGFGELPGQRMQIC